MVDVFFQFPLDMQDGLPENDPDSAPLLEDEVRSFPCIFEFIYSFEMYYRSCQFIVETCARLFITGGFCLKPHHVRSVYRTCDYTRIRTSLGAARRCSTARISHGCREVSL